MGTQVRNHISALVMRLKYGDTDRGETILEMALHTLTGTPRDLGLLSLSSLDNFT